MINTYLGNPPAEVLEYIKGETADITYSLSTDSSVQKFAFGNQPKWTVPFDIGLAKKTRVGSQQQYSWKPGVEFKRIAFADSVETLAGGNKTANVIFDAPISSILLPAGMLSADGYTLASPALTSI